jgi:hypothetical protein
VVTALSSPVRERLSSQLGLLSPLLSHNLTNNGLRVRIQVNDDNNNYSSEILHHSGHYSPDLAEESLYDLTHVSSTFRPCVWL